jgi:hypothetical protein
MIGKRELKAMAWSCGVTVPIGFAAIYRGSASFTLDVLLLLIGFLITLVCLN